MLQEAGQHGSGGLFLSERGGEPAGQCGAVAKQCIVVRAELFANVGKHGRGGVLTSEVAQGSEGETDGCAGVCGLAGADVSQLDRCPVC